MKRGVTVTGTGHAAAAPDVLRLELGAEMVGRSPQEALTEAGRALDQMRSTLRHAGVADPDLTSGTMSLWPRYEEKGKVSGYSAELRLTARLRDLGAAGELVSKTVLAGGKPARLHGMSFEHSDPTGLYEAAREAAWRSAEASARQYAQLAGRDLGPVLSVAETPGNGPVHPVLLRGADMAMAEAVPIEPGSTAVTVRVEVRYAFAVPVTELSD